MVQGLALPTEEEGPSWCLDPCPLDQPGLDGADIVYPQRVGGGEAPLEPSDVEDAALEIHLLQHLATGPLDPEPMTKNQHN